MLAANGQTTTQAKELWLVDGYNVLHAVLLGARRRVPWWRQDYQQRVLDWALTVFPEPRLTLAVTLVFDAARPLDPREALTHDWMTLCYVPDADQWIVQRCLGRASDSQHSTHVVTADRSLSDRVVACGAVVTKPWQL